MKKQKNKKTKTKIFLCFSFASYFYFILLSLLSTPNTFQFHAGHKNQQQASQTKKSYTGIMHPAASLHPPHTHYAEI